MPSSSLTSSRSFTSSPVISSCSANLRSIRYVGMFAILYRARRVDQRMAIGVAGGLGAVRRTGFAQNAADVVGDGMPADAELLADPAVAQPGGDEAQDLHLASRQIVGE